MFSKFVFALSFALPVLLLELSSAVIVSIAWGLSLISVFSYYIAKQRNSKPYKAVIEHLVIAVLVIIATHYVGQWIGALI